MSSRSLWRAASTVAVAHDDRTDGHVAVFEGGARLVERELHPRRVRAWAWSDTAADGSGFAMAEGVGFEPTVRLPHTRFPSVPIRPLSHPSTR